MRGLEQSRALLLGHGQAQIKRGRPEARPWRYLQGQTELRAKRKIEVLVPDAPKG